MYSFTFRNPGNWYKVREPVDLVRLMSCVLVLGVLLGVHQLVQARVVLVDLDLHEPTLVIGARVDLQHRNPTFRQESRNRQEFHIQETNTEPSRVV